MSRVCIYEQMHPNGGRFPVSRFGRGDTLPVLGISLSCTAALARAGVVQSGSGAMRRGY